MCLCRFISQKISGVYGLNVVTYGMMCDSFDFSVFFNKHVLSSNFIFSILRLPLVLMDIFVFLSKFLNSSNR